MSQQEQIENRYSLGELLDQIDLEKEKEE